MNFFEQQQRARRNTGLLLLYFALALLGILLGVGLLSWLVLLISGVGLYPLPDFLLSPALLWVYGLTLVIIAGGSLWRLWRLRDGGHSLMALMNAIEVTPDTGNSIHQRYRNVVEEMAIASGIPCPRTYVLHRENGINALVAGFRPTEVVMAVTQGALDQLSRDELQGVIAHEFSHIFNNDMRLNMQLISLLHGILMLGKTGNYLLRHSFYIGNTTRSQRNRGNNQAGGALAVLAFGLGLVIIGAIGVFFGRLIKAAIARQREFLADASAVQFTRLPDGIAGALIRIRNGNGSHLHSAYREDVSHFCFEETMPHHFNRLFATHPPIEARLAAIGAKWPVIARHRTATAPNPSHPASTVQGASAYSSFNPVQGLVGTVHSEHILYARSLLSSIPVPLYHQIHQPTAAVWVALAMALQNHPNPDAAVSTLSCTALEKNEILQLVSTIKGLGTRLRLPIVDLLIPSLKQLPPSQRQALLDSLDQLFENRHQSRLFDFLLRCLLHEHLDERAARNTKIRFHQFAHVQDQLQLIMSVMVHATGMPSAQREALFTGFARTLLSDDRKLIPLANLRFSRVEKALLDLRDLTPLLKGALLEMLADIVLADKKIQVQEAELLRVVATLLDTPLPPVRL